MIEGVGGGEVIGELSRELTGELISGRRGKRPIGTPERKWDAGLPEIGSACWFARGSEHCISFNSRISLETK
jgi:hypothetical protein